MPTIASDGLREYFDERSVNQGITARVGVGNADSTAPAWLAN
ncbi:MAG: hypothetical protein ACO1SV_02050 [Fimbriimonas sp.]